LEGLGQHRTP